MGRAVNGSRKKVVGIRVAGYREEGSIKVWFAETVIICVSAIAWL